MNSGAYERVSSAARQAYLARSLTDAGWVAGTVMSVLLLVPEMISYRNVSSHVSSRLGVTPVVLLCGVCASGQWVPDSRRSTVLTASKFKHNKKRENGVHSKRA